MSEIAATLEATALAQFLKGSRWIYPLVNAGHIFGIALLVGAVIPLDLTHSGLLKRIDPRAAASLLQPFALTGLLLAFFCGALLFITQAGDYLGNPIFLAKMVLVAAATLNAVLHLRIERARGSAVRAIALVSLAIWPTVLLLGRLVGYHIG